MHGGFHLRRKHPNPPNRIRIRSATQRAWVLDLEASSRREGISTKTSLAKKSQLKEKTSRMSNTFVKIGKNVRNNKTANCVAIITLISMKPQLGSYYKASHEAPAWQGYSPVPSTTRSASCPDNFLLVFAFIQNHYAS